MEPNVFMSDFERTMWSDDRFGMLGRILVFATRFEASARALALWVDLKATSGAFASEDIVESLIDAAWERRLFMGLRHLGLDKGEVADTLKTARRARNSVVHEVSLGFDRCLNLLPATAVEHLEQDIRALVQALAKGDRIICALLSVVTNEHMPSLEFFNSYPDVVEKWVCDSQRSLDEASRSGIN